MVVVADVVRERVVVVAGAVALAGVVRERVVVVADAVVVPGVVRESELWLWQVRWEWHVCL